MAGAKRGELAFVGRDYTNGTLWPGMQLDEDAPNRRQNAVCVDCPTKMNSYNAAQNIRCHPCQRKWREKAEALAEPMLDPSFYQINAANTKQYDRMILDFCEGLLSEKGQVYYGNIIEDISELTGRRYESMRSRVRRMCERGDLVRLGTKNSEAWSLPDKDYHFDEQLSLIENTDGVVEQRDLNPKSKYEGVWYNSSWKGKQWGAYVKDDGATRMLGYSDTEEEAHDLVVSFKEMRERKKEAHDGLDDAVLELEEDEVSFLMEETYV